MLRAGGVAWSRLLAQAEQRRFVLRAAAMLTYVRQRFAAPIPEEVLRRLRALPVSRLGRFEFWVGNRRQGVLGELPSYWCKHRRLRADGQLSWPLGFPRYLQQVWNLPTLGEVPGAALGRARTRMGFILPEPVGARPPGLLVKRLDGTSRVRVPPATGDKTVTSALARMGSGNHRCFS